MPHATIRPPFHRCVALIASAALVVLSCGHDRPETKVPHPAAAAAAPRSGGWRGSGDLERPPAVATIDLSLPGRPEVRVPARVIDGRRYASAMALLGALGLEVTFRPARGELATRVGRKPLRMTAGRSEIDYGGHIYHTAAAARAAGDDLLLPEEFVGPLRAAFIEAGGGEADGAAPVASALGTVVIDPGHGGANAGAKGPGGILEKDLTLEVSRQLARILQDDLGCRVVLTRETDRSLSLPERTAIANREHADLFVSVHANASPSRAASGYETFILSATASDAESKRIADEENAAGGAEEAAVAGFLQLTLDDLVRAESMEESARLAALVQRFMGRAMASENRGVKQAPFWVLAGADMPAVLVEIGFITNPAESRRLGNPATQARIARSMADAVATFRAELDRRRGLSAQALP